MRTVRPVLLSLGLLSTIGMASAADTTTFNVKIAITKACTITAASATDVDFRFGTLDLHGQRRRQRQRHRAVHRIDPIQHRIERGRQCRHRQ